MKISDVVLVEWAPAVDPTATPTGGDWVDLTATGYVRGFKTEVGRPSVFDHIFGVGRATVYLQNHEALLDVGEWHRWRQVRISDVDNGQIFWGYIEDVPHEQLPMDATAALVCLDAMSRVSRVEFADSEFGALNGMTACDASSTMVGASGLPTPTIVGPSNCRVRFASPDVGADRGSNFLAVLQTLMETEIGAVCQQPQDAPGALEIRGRYSQPIALAATPAAVLSSTPGTGEIQLQPPLVMSAPGENYRNSVICAGASGVVFDASDVPAGYPADTLSRTHLLSENDEWVRANADLLLNLHKSTTASPKAVTVQMYPHRLEDPSGGYRAAVCALRLGDVVTVTATPVGASEQTWECFVERISHTVSHDTGWQATLGLSSAAPWGDAYDDLLILDTDDLDSGKIWAP